MKNKARLRNFCKTKETRVTGQLNAADMLDRILGQKEDNNGKTVEIQTEVWSL